MTSHQRCVIVNIVINKILLENYNLQFNRISHQNVLS